MCCIGCCVGSCLYQTVSNACGCKPSGRSGSLVPYFILTLVSVTLAIILRYSATDGMESLYYKSVGDCNTARCLGYGAVFRISFATFTFFLTHALLLLFQACWSVDRFNWLGKFLYWCCLLVLSYILPEEFYADFYVHVSRVIAGLFLFLQIVILIDMAHSINEGLNTKSEGEGKATLYKAIIIGASLAALIASGVFMGLFYYYFGKSGCQLNQFFISFTLCVTLILIVLSVTEKFSEKGGLLPASIVTLYCWWLCYSGLSSDPSSCNTLGGRQETTQLVLGLIIAAGSIAYAGWSVGTHANLFGVEEEAAAKTIEEKAAAEIELGRVDGDRDAAHERALGVEKEERTEDERLVAKRNFKFHMVMASCAMYMAMLLTNWGSTSIANDIEYENGAITGEAYDLSRESMWIKFVSMWLTMLLYGWSIIAPVVCQGRDFS